MSRFTACVVESVWSRASGQQAVAVATSRLHNIAGKYTGTSYFDGPPLVSCAAFSEHGGILSEPQDCFAHPFWDTVRDGVARKAIDIRRQGFFGAAMLPMSELEYTGIMQKLDQLGGRFKVRHAAQRRSDVDREHNSATQMDETRQEEEHVSSPA